MLVIQSPELEGWTFHFWAVCTVCSSPAYGYQWVRKASQSTHTHTYVFRGRGQHQLCVISKNTVRLHVEHSFLEVLRLCQRHVAKDAAKDGGGQHKMDSKYSTHIYTHTDSLTHTHSLTHTWTGGIHMDLCKFYGPKNDLFPCGWSTHMC